MSEVNQEIESLRAKNAELLSELKTAKQQLRDEKEANALDAGHLAAARKELTTIKTADLLNSSWAAAGVAPEMAEFAIQKIGFELSIDDDGKIVAVCKETGKPIGDNDTEEAADPKTVLINAFEELRGPYDLFFGRSQGGGAIGDFGAGYRSSTPAADTAPAKAKPVQTGLR